jgi:hypothetical protein
MNKNLLTLAFSLFLFQCAFAQSVTYNNVMRFNGRGNNEITKNDELVGYYSFFFVEKADKKNNIFEVNITDNSLNTVSKFEVVRDKKSFLFEVTFNGEVFTFVFYNYKGKESNLEFLMYDKSGKNTGSFVASDLSKWQFDQLNMQIQQPEVSSNNCFALPNKGAVLTYSIDVGKKNGFAVVGVDNTGKKFWEYRTKENAEMHEFADILAATSKYVVVSKSAKKNVLTRDMESELLVLDATNGEELFSEKLSGNTGTQYNLLNVFIDEERDEFILFGELFKPEDKPLKDPSSGLYIEVLARDGSLKSMNKYLWAKEINKVKKQKMTEEQKENEKKSGLYIHQIFRSGGSIFVIAEQYRKAVSAAGVAMQVLNKGQSGASAFEIVVGDMVVLQFGEDYTIQDYQIIEKKQSRVLLPSGYGLASSAVLARYIAAYGEFDYSFTTSDKKNSKYSSIYIDANRKEENSKTKSDVMLGVISITSGTLSTSRVPINSDARSFWIKPAKPGFVAISEYFKKEKKVILRLESVK